MNNLKKNVWSISAAIVYGVTILVTIGLFVKLIGLNMLPTKYIGLAILTVVFLMLLVFICFRTQTVIAIPC